jgi:hypothetical protein
MFIQNRIQNAAISMVSSSLVSNGITNWSIYDSFATGSLSGVDNAPMVQVICDKWVEDNPNAHLGVGKCTLRLATFAEKKITTATEFETVSDIVFNPFLSASAASSITAIDPSLIVAAICDMGLDVQTAKDGWMATQDIELVCGRLY